MQLWLKVKVSDQSEGKPKLRKALFNRNRVRSQPGVGPPFNLELLRGIRVFGPFYEAVFSQILELSPEGKNFDSRPSTPTPVLC